ncbi:hypothetical protein KSD_24670 [Ktedonobacter sp. SOSP1-85]|nr:hypothetical protein KSD_24670 [Ktedonobacter sp. SOSP1-85]
MMFFNDGLSRHSANGWNVQPNYTLKKDNKGILYMSSREERAQKAQMHPTLFLPACAGKRSSNHTTKRAAMHTLTPYQKVYYAPSILYKSGKATSRLKNGGYGGEQGGSGQASRISG